MSLSSVQIGAINKYISKADKLAKAIEVKAINNLAFEARKDELKHIAKIFDRPTPLVKFSVRVKKTTRHSVPAKIFVVDKALPYLIPHHKGGQRRDKGAEKALQSIGVISSGYQTVVGRNAPKDRYGNIRRGVLKSALSALSSKAKSSKYYAITPEQAKRRGVMAGVYQRLKTKSKILLIFVKSGSIGYRRSFNFESVARQSVAKNKVKAFKEARQRVMKGQK